MNEQYPLHPLTPSQSDFAAQRHELVFQYLNSSQLPEEEFYDEVILAYLWAVQQYDEQPELQQSEFAAVAFAAMDSAVSCFLENQHIRQSREISLQAPSRHGLPVEETIGEDDPRFYALEQKETGACCSVGEGIPGRTNRPPYLSMNPPVSCRVYCSVPAA